MFHRMVLFIFSTLFLLTASTLAQSPIVQVALFYSPTCPHCHDIINNYLPPVQDKYGDSLQIFYINVQERDGAALFYDACEALKVSEDRCGGVPFMVIGDQHMVGSAEIPSRMEGLVDAGLAAGGQNLSTLPLLWQLMEAQAQQGQAQAAPPQEATWQEKFSRDVLANSLAVAILLVLLLSVLLGLLLSQSAFSGQALPAWAESLGQWLAAGSPLGAGLMAFSIVIGGEALPAIAAALVVVILMGVALVVVVQARTASQRYRLIPAAVVGGLLVAFYMSYVEVGQMEAVCGAVGDCNAVQSSPYASILGLPIGVLGLLGYGLILLAWAISLGQGSAARYAQTALLALALFGVGFSAYLTFLEPFVIGASCAWCLTSALVMLAILWLAAPALWAASAQAHKPQPQPVSASA